MSEKVLVSHNGGVSTITLNNPPLNLLSFELLTALSDAFDALEARNDTRCVVLTGAGTKAFSAGADLGEEARHDAEAGRSFRALGRRMVERIETFPKPVVTAVRGWCIGGGTGLAWVGDIRLAAESAKFRAGDVYLGIIPTWSVGMVRLVHYLGRNRTLDLLLLGEDVSGAQALELGLVSKVFPDGRFEDDVRAVAQRLAGGAPLPFRAIKEAVRSQYRDTVDRATLLEEQWSARILDSSDAKEGITAFKEKRKPAFRGR
jgi:enoyl-CoA hydratase